jgi:hypothetical protein
MRIWLGLLVAPLIALADQIVSYAAVGWACVHGYGFAVHGAHALFLAAALAATLVAWPLWQAARSARPGSEAVAQRRFLAGLALLTGAFAVLVIATLWMPTWIIAPCSD